MPVFVPDQAGRQRPLARKTVTVFIMEKSSFCVKSRPEAGLAAYPQKLWKTLWISPNRVCEFLINQALT